MIETYERAEEDPRCRTCSKPIYADQTHCGSCQRRVAAQGREKVVGWIFSLLLWPGLAYLVRYQMNARALYWLGAVYIAILTFKNKKSQAELEEEVPVPLGASLAGFALGLGVLYVPWHLLR